MNLDRASKGGPSTFRRESWPAYLEREVVVDPDAEAAEAERQRKIAVQREARLLLRKNQVAGEDDDRPAAVAHVPPRTPVGRGAAAALHASTTSLPASGSASRAAGSEGRAAGRGAAGAGGRDGSVARAVAATSPGSPSGDDSRPTDEELFGLSVKDAMVTSKLAHSFRATRAKPPEVSKLFAPLDDPLPAAGAPARGGARGIGSPSPSPIVSASAPSASRGVLKTSPIASRGATGGSRAGLTSPGSTTSSVRFPPASPGSPSGSGPSRGGGTRGSSSSTTPASRPISVSVAHGARPPTTLPRLVDDPRFGSAPLDEMRTKRWVELRYLHAFMRARGRKLEAMVENVALQGTIRRALFVVNMTGFLELRGWDEGVAMEPHFNGLFDSLDVSSSGSIDPREIQCGLRLLDKPTETPASLILWCFDLYSFKPDDKGKPPPGVEVGGMADDPMGYLDGSDVMRVLDPSFPAPRRRAQASDGPVVTRRQLLPLLFLPVTTRAEEAAIKSHIPELARAFEKYVGHPLPALIPRSTLSLVISESFRFMDEFRRQCMRRLPDDVRLSIMRRSTEEVCLRVEAYERSMRVQKGALFLRDRVEPRQRREVFVAWRDYTREQSGEKEVSMRADALFRKQAARRAIRWWRRLTNVPRANKKAKPLCRFRRKRRFFLNWKRHARYFHVLNRTTKAKSEVEFERRYRRAMDWAAEREARERATLLRAAWWAFFQEHLRGQRAKKAARIIKERNVRRCFVAWKGWAKTEHRTRVAEEARREAEKARIEREVETQLKAQELEAKRKREAEAEEARRQQEYDIIMQKQRLKAAVLAAYDEAAKSLVMRRAFQRQRVFQTLLRGGAREWEKRKPTLMKRARDSAWKWLHDDPAGREALADRVEYVLQSIEIPVPPDGLVPGRAGDAGGGGVAGGGTAAPVGGPGLPPITPRAAASALPPASVVSGSSKPPPSAANRLEQLEDFGLLPVDVWQLTFRYTIVARVWVNSQTGEAYGPRGGVVTADDEDEVPTRSRTPRKLGADSIPPISRRIATRIAEDNWMARKEEELDKEVEKLRTTEDERRVRDGYAIVIQEWFRAYRRILRWREVFNAAKRVRYREKLREAAFQRKQAATTIQCAWRSALARREVRWRLLGAWQVMGQFEDPQAVYYLHTNTGATQWEPPSFLYHLTVWNWHRDRRRRVIRMPRAQRDVYFSMNGGTGDFIHILPELMSVKDKKKYGLLRADGARPALEDRPVDGRDSRAEDAGDADEEGYRLALTDGGRRRERLALQDGDEFDESEGGAGRRDRVGSSDTHASGKSGRSGSAGGGGPRGKTRRGSAGAAGGGGGGGGGGSGVVRPKADVLPVVEDPFLPQEPRTWHWSVYEDVGGSYYYCHENGRMQAEAPAGFIVCEMCRIEFAALYIAEIDQIMCSKCFLKTHNKPTRVGTAGYVVYPGPYDSVVQAPVHVNRTPEQLFGAEFCAPPVKTEGRKELPYKVFYVFDKEAVERGLVPG